MLTIHPCQCYDYYLVIVWCDLIGNAEVPETAVQPPSYVYEPNHCQVAYANLSRNRERNLGVLTTILFNKTDDHTVLRITWEVSDVMMMM